MRQSVPPAGQLRAIGIWLLAVAGLVFVMIVLGGVTRLTESGLSMVEWRPVTGWLPPLSMEGWERAFAAYKAFPEYQKVNAGMSLSAFQTIYWFEYSHRLLGRFIGLAFAVPFLVFLLRRAVPGWLVPRLAGLLLLGGLQGAVGWFMVQSGLVDRPDVSQYRLAMHLGLAFLIFGALLWTALSCLRPPTQRPMAALQPRGPVVLAAALLALVFLQVLAGALVAGLNAGMTYNTWPLMDGRLIPAGLGLLSPWWLNLFETVTTVQFQHRCLGYLILLGAALLWLQALRIRRRGGTVAGGAGLVLVAVILQILIGIVTLLLVVPVPVAAVHQAGAVAVVALLVGHLHDLVHPAPAAAPLPASGRAPRGSKAEAPADG